MPRYARLRLFAGKKLTFLYVPDNASVRQFLVPRVALYVACAGLCLVLGLNGFFVSRYLATAPDARDVGRLRARVAQLQDSLQICAELTASLAGDVKTVTRQHQELLNVAGLQELGNDVLQAGIGGPSPRTPGSTALQPDLRAQVDGVGARLSQLLRQVHMQRQSYGEILTALENKRTVWDHTPSVRPLGYCTLTSHYGRRMDPFTGHTALHRGVDFAAQPGTAIHSTADGQVTMAERWGSYGLTVEIDHGTGLRSRYAHCMSLRVRVGQKVKRGEIIALVGSSGKSSGSHVHYEVIKDGLQEDPMTYVLPENTDVD